MTTHHHPQRHHAALCFALTALSCASAQAVPVPQEAVQRMQPAANCQPAREYPDLRVREVEIDNIGTTNAYVICELMPPFWQSPDMDTTLTGVSMIRLRFHNAGPAAATIQCNLQDSLSGSYPVPTRKSEVTVEPGASGFVTYLPIGQPAAPGLIELSRAGAQCILPPGTSLTNTSVHFSFDVDII